MCVLQWQSYRNSPLKLIPASEHKCVCSAYVTTIIAVNVYCVFAKLRIFAILATLIADEVIVTFDQEYLKVLYVEGKDCKKHRFQPDIIRRYKRCIDYLRQAKRIEELLLIASLHYEVLVGDKAGISSIRVNDQYRVEFTVRTEGEPVITICNILELSNHYK